MLGASVHFGQEMWEGLHVFVNMIDFVNACTLLDKSFGPLKSVETFSSRLASIILAQRRVIHHSKENFSTRYLLAHRVGRY